MWSIEIRICNLFAFLLFSLGLDYYITAAAAAGARAKYWSIELAKSGLLAQKIKVNDYSYLQFLPELGRRRSPASSRRRRLARASAWSIELMIDHDNAAADIQSQPEFLFLDRDPRCRTRSKHWSIEMSPCVN